MSFNTVPPSLLLVRCGGASWAGMNQSPHPPAPHAGCLWTVLTGQNTVDLSEVLSRREGGGGLFVGGSGGRKGVSPSKRGERSRRFVDLQGVRSCCHHLRNAPSWGMQGKIWPGLRGEVHPENCREVALSVFAFHKTK